MELSTGAWGDAAIGMLKPRTETKPDKDGVRIVTTYRHAADGGVEKVVQRVKRKERRIHRVPPSVAARAGMKKFGLAAIGSGENITYVSADEVRIEHPDEQAAPILNPTQSSMFGCRICGKSGHWTLACPFKETMANGGTLPDDDDGPSTMSGTGLSSGMGLTKGSAGAYKPPHLQGGAAAEAASAPQDDSKRTLKVTNLTREADRDDLRELFQPFGSIERVNVVRERETQISRGMAFVCFYMREDAAKALAALDGHPYDYQILSVEWAKPRTERPGQRSLSEMRHVTGYGKALPQGR